MGKMLIIRGATYTPSGSQGDPDSGNSGNSGNNGNNDNPSVNPNPQPTPQVRYGLYYMSGTTMYRDRSQAAHINAVALVVADPADKDIMSVSADIAAMQNAGAQAVVGCVTGSEIGGETFTYYNQEWAEYVDMVQSGVPYPVSSIVKTLMILISKSSYSLTLSSSEVDAIVAAAPTAITFDD